MGDTYQGPNAPCGRIEVTEHDGKLAGEPADNVGGSGEVPGTNSSEDD